MEITGILLSLAALLMGFYIAFQAIPVIIRVSTLKGLMDPPDGQRKLHKEVIPNLGGIGVFAGFIISYGIFIGFDLPSYFPALISAVTILFFIGIKDDILLIAPLKKLTGQIIAAVIVVYIGGIYLPGLDGLFGVGTFPVWFAKIFSVVAIVYIINAYNLIDGVDGLAGMLTIVSSYVLGIWFLAGGHHADAILCFSITGAVLGFMMHNFEPAKIFMGDTGSLIIGLILAVSAFRLVQLNPVTEGLHLEAPAVFILSVMIVPIFDALRVFIIRMVKGCSPLKADNNHIHHFLLRLGLRHYQIALVLTFFNVVIILSSFGFQFINTHIYLIVVVVSAALIPPTMVIMKNILVNFFLNKKRYNMEMVENMILQELESEGLKAKKEIAEEEFAA